MSVLMERSLRKLSTGEDNVTNGQASGKQRWDAWSEVQGQWVGARAVLTLAEILLGGAAVRMAHGLSFSSPALYPGPLFSQIQVWRRTKRETVRPDMHCQHSVYLVGLQPYLPL